MPAAKAQISMCILTAWSGPSLSPNRIIGNSSRKHTYINFNLLKPHFWIVKLGFTGIYIFLISVQKHRFWVLVRLPWWGTSRNMQNRIFIWKLSVFGGETFNTMYMWIGVFSKWRALNPCPAEPGLFCKQCRSEEANWSGSALFVIQFVNLHQESGLSNRIGWQLEMVVAS